MLNAIAQALLNFSWAIIIFFSLTGWGALVLKVTKVGEVPAWVNPAIGAATFILIGGWLDLSGQASTLPLLAMMAGGIVAWVTLGKVPKSLAWPKAPADKAILGCGLVLALLHCYTRTGAAWDDTAAYFPICHEMLANGSSWAPMSLRRALTWGGQFPLQGLGLLAAGDSGGSIYEPIIPLLILTSLGLGLPIQGWKKALTGCALLLLPLNGMNSAPNALVCILLLAAWQTRKQPHQILMVACLAAAMALRIQSAGFVAVFLAMEFFTTGKRQGIAEALKQGFTRAGGILLALSPFMLMQYIQFQTPCSLLWPGTINPDYLNLRGTWDQSLVMIGTIALTLPPVLIMLALGIRSPETRSVSIAGLVVLALSPWLMADLPGEVVIRYTWPYICAPLLALIINCPQKASGWMLATCVWPMAALGHNIIYTGLSIWERPERECKEKAVQIEQTLPENASIAVVATWANAFDPGKRRILNLDIVQAIKGLPAEGSKETWIQWADLNGVDYLIHDGIFSKDPKRGRHMVEIWGRDRRIMQKAFDTLNKNFRSWKEGPYTVIDLRNPES
jgi:hypothetical protein